MRVESAVMMSALCVVYRYLAIFFPQTNKLSPRGAVIMIGLIWIVPMCIFVPWTVVYAQKAYVIKGHQYVVCTATWTDRRTERMFMLGAVFLTCYFIPLLFIAIFYMLIGIRVWKRQVRGMRGTRAQRNIHQSKIRIVRMLVVVFVIFALFWLPLYSINLRIQFSDGITKQEKNMMRKYLIPFAQWLGAANSCVNPFVYCYYSNSFRRSIVNLLRSRSCCGKITS